MAVPPISEWAYRSSGICKPQRREYSSESEEKKYQDKEYRIRLFLIIFIVYRKKKNWGDQSQLLGSYFLLDNNINITADNITP